MTCRITVNLRIQARSQTQNRVSNIRRGPNLIAIRDAGGFYSWFYGKLKLLLWVVSVSCYAAFVAFQTPVTENIISITCIYHTNSFVNENASFVDFEMAKLPGI